MDWGIGSSREACGQGSGQAFGHGGCGGDKGEGERSRFAASICQRRHDRMGQGPTEPRTGRSTFLLSAGGARGGNSYVALDTGPILTENQFPCQMLVACQERRLHLRVLPIYLLVVLCPALGLPRGPRLYLYVGFAPEHRVRPIPPVRHGAVPGMPGGAWSGGAGGRCR